MNIDVPYGITKRLSKVTLDDARGRIKQALEKEGFGVLTEIDVRATLQNKLGVQIDPYVILGACNPQLAHRALGVDPGIGLLLPCNVVVTADGEDAVISIASPRAMFGAIGPNEKVAAIADEAETRLRRALETLV
jgi:uncharacterized protein (DUF302 family)